MKSQVKIILDERLPKYIKPRPALTPQQLQRLRDGDADFHAMLVGMVGPAAAAVIFREHVAGRGSSQ